MALMSQGIVNGDMPWPLVIAGAFLAVGLILIKAPAPMLIAVGMYLPFYATAGIFVGGLFRWGMELKLKREDAGEKQKRKAENTGVLISSGLIAGGALTAVVIAFLVLGYNMVGTVPGAGDPGYAEHAAYTAELGLKADELPTFLDSMRGAIGLNPQAWLGLIAFLGVLYLLAWVPVKASRE
jgi:hypothetical protein